MKKYEKYKHSGIDWLGKIPEHWEVKKIKYIVSVQKGKVPANMSPTNSGNWPIYLAMDYLRGEAKQIFFVPEYEKFVLVDENEILLLWDGSNAGEFMWSKKGVLSSTMAVIKSKTNIHKTFLFYRFKALERYLKDITVGMGIPHVNPQEFLNFSFFIPSFHEQTAIAEYLDRKTAQIDELIADKKRLLELYEEEKTAIINQAVTGKLSELGWKGLENDRMIEMHNNPTIQKSEKSKCRPLKHSGIDWLGEIPEHWEVKKLKYAAEINKETISEKTDGNFLLKYIDISNVGFGILKEEPKELLFSNAPSRARRVVKSSDTLISTVRTYLKSILFIENADDNLIASTGFAVITPKTFFYPKFLFYVLSSEIIIQNITANSVGVSYPAINASEIGNFYVWLPPKKEQTAIVDYIEKEISRINAKAEKTKKLIELLEEYKQALISEVVTGKVKVV